MSETTEIKTRLKVTVPEISEIPFSVKVYEVIKQIYELEEWLF